MTTTTTTPEVRAIPTTYEGITFRSRLEARWAVFFTAIKTPWQYEPEGFHLPAGQYDTGSDGWEVTLTRDWNYLPDFYLPELDSWFEVKGVQPADDYRTMLHAFQISSGKRMLIAVGSLPFGDDDHWCEECIEVIGDYQYAFCRCTICDKLGCEFNGRGDRVCRGAHGNIGDKGYNQTEDIVQALSAARSYRFWDPRRG